MNTWRDRRAASRPSQITEFFDHLAILGGHHYGKEKDARGERCVISMPRRPCGRSRAVAMAAELLYAHASHAGHKTSAEWLAALIGRSQTVNSAARGYLNATEPAQATA
jgi:hypothetical protein